jgi:hypothetical protein
MSGTKTILIVEERIVERHTCFGSNERKSFLIFLNIFFNFSWVLNKTKHFSKMVLSFKYKSLGGPKLN